MRDVNANFSAIYDVLRGSALLTPDVLKSGTALLQAQVPDRYNSIIFFLCTNDVLDGRINGRAHQNRLRGCRDWWHEERYDQHG